MLIVPTIATPSQALNVQLNGQNCTLNIYQKFFGLFMDVYLAGVATPVVAGVLCQNANRIIRDLYLGFSGDFVWIDQQPSQTNGPSDPIYTGLGVRYLLFYLAPADLPPGIG